MSSPPNHTRPVTLSGLRITPPSTPLRAPIPPFTPRTPRHGPRPATPNSDADDVLPGAFSLDDLPKGNLLVVRGCVSTNAAHTPVTLVKDAITNIGTLPNYAYFASLTFQVSPFHERVTSLSSACYIELRLENPGAEPRDNILAALKEELEKQKPDWEVRWSASGKGKSDKCMLCRLLNLYPAGTDRSGIPTKHLPLILAHIKKKGFKVASIFASFGGPQIAFMLPKDADRFMALSTIKVPPQVSRNRTTIQPLKEVVIQRAFELVVTGAQDFKGLGDLVAKWARRTAPDSFLEVTGLVAALTRQLEEVKSGLAAVQQQQSSIRDNQEQMAAMMMGMNNRITDTQNALLVQGRNQQNRSRVIDLQSQLSSANLMLMMSGSGHPLADTMRTQVASLNCDLEEAKANLANSSRQIASQSTPVVHPPPGYMAVAPTSHSSPPSSSAIRRHHSGQLLPPSLLAQPPRGPMIVIPASLPVLSSSVATKHRRTESLPKAPVNNPLVRPCELAEGTLMEDVDDLYPLNLYALNANGLISAVKLAVISPLIMKMLPHVFVISETKTMSLAGPGLRVPDYKIFEEKGQVVAVDVMVPCPSHSFIHRVFAVYAPCDPGADGLSRRFWPDLMSMVLATHTSWLLLGDLNATVSASEQASDNAHSRQLFNNFLHDTRATDLWQQTPDRNHFMDWTSWAWKSTEGGNIINRVVSSKAALVDAEIFADPAWIPGTDCWGIVARIIVAPSGPRNTSTSRVETGHFKPFMPTPLPRIEFPVKSDKHLYSLFTAAVDRLVAKNEDDLTAAIDCDDAYLKRYSKLTEIILGAGKDTFGRSKMYKSISRKITSHRIRELVVNIQHLGGAILNTRRSPQCISYGSTRTLLRLSLEYKSMVPRPATDLVSFLLATRHQAYKDLYAAKKAEILLHAQKYDQARMLGALNGGSTKRLMNGSLAFIALPTALESATMPGVIETEL
ncbi:hypothetical protein B0H34DRAFT_678764 [Crassisporium funariophilum]|nr:hypothetical protein B0H34DRAFT_678764 [Crassisporium funariophilum]